MTALGRSHGTSTDRRRAKRAQTLAAGAAVAVLASYTILSVALVVGGDEAISDNWVGAQAAIVLAAALVVSLVALVLGLVAKVHRQRSGQWWLPLAVFPTLLVLLVLAELFVIE